MLLKYCITLRAIVRLVGLKLKMKNTLHTDYSDSHYNIIPLSCSHCSSKMQLNKLMKLFEVQIVDNRRFILLNLEQWKFL